MNAQTEPHIRQLEARIQIFKEGGKWEVRDTQIAQSGWVSCDGWTDLYTFPWPRYEIRVTPRTLGRTVNGHTLAPGQGWHRKDWTQEMLPEGWRPLIKGEGFVRGDELSGAKKPNINTGWTVSTRPDRVEFYADGTEDRGFYCRTSRPLPPSPTSRRPIRRA